MYQFFPQTNPALKDPDTKYEGLVTTITDIAPIMNWVYIDKDTYEVKYGVRADAQPNLTGPFDCTRQDRRLTFDGWEGFCVVEEAPMHWALYFDKDDDGLHSKLKPGTRVLEIELVRREKRWKKEIDARQQDQTTKRAVEVKENPPVDNPIMTQPDLQTPGVVNVTERTQEKPKPFSLPKSIFSDPPRPLYWQFGRSEAPKTPPPAYSNGANIPEQTSGNYATPIMSLSPSINPTLVKSETKTLVLPPGPLQKSPPGEKRVTPKLNRSSGTRAIAQAQIFEAWASGKTPPEDFSLRNSEINSRPISNPLSEFSYYEGAVTGTSEFFSMNSHSSMLPKHEPSPQFTTSKQPVDPAVFARLSSGSSTASDPAVVKERAGDSQTLAEGGSGKQSTIKASSRVDPPSGRRAASAARYDQAASPEFQRNLSMSKTSRSMDNIKPGSSNSRNLPKSWQRKVSTSSPSQKDSNLRSVPKPLERTNTTPLRRPMAATMSSSTKSRTIATRNNKGQVPAGPRPERKATNSSIYREISDLVGGTTRSRSGTVSSREDARTLDGPPPLRRKTTTRDMRKDERLKTVSDKSRDDD